jgi:hypothetical protein
MPNNGESPGMRDVAAMNFYNGTVLFYGSLAITSMNFSTKSLFSYDLTLLKWTYVQTKDTPDPIIYQTQVVYKDTLYELFGITVNLQWNSFYKLNLTTLTWENEIQLESH